MPAAVDFLAGCNSKTPEGTKRHESYEAASAQRPRTKAATGEKPTLVNAEQYNTASSKWLAVSQRCGEGAERIERRTTHRIESGRADSGAGHSL